MEYKNLFAPYEYVSYWARKYLYYEISKQRSNDDVQMYVIELLFFLNIIKREKNIYISNRETEYL